jgi:uncharacterized protein (DUF433 family)
MTKSAMNIFIRVISRRIEAGEDLEDILNSYPKLTEEEKNEIRERLAN